MDYTILITDKSEFLSLIPAVTFGYIYHLTGLWGYLIWSILMVVPAGVAIHSNEKGYYFKFSSDLSIPKKIVSVILFAPFLVSFGAGPLILISQTNLTNIISVSLVIANFGFMLFAYSEAIVEYLGEPIESENQEEPE